MSRHLLRGALLMVGALFLCNLVACSSERPLHAVKADGEWAYQHGQFDKAQDDFSEYVRRRPEDIDVRYQLAKAYLGSNEPKPAIEQLNIALDVQPLNDTFLDAQAEAMYKAGERDALTALLSRNAAERGRVSDYLRLGAYSARMGNADEAQQALFTAAKLDGGKSVVPQRALADFYGSVGDRSKQIKHLRMAYAIEPANEETLKEIRRLGEVPGPSFALAPDTIAPSTRTTKVPDDK
jgi:tetratricopeptide (TPR) repeat protein